MAEIDSLRTLQPTVLHLTKQNRQWTVSTPDKSLVIPVTKVSTTKLLLFGKPSQRTYAWFVFEGRRWFGHNQGDSPLLHCKPIRLARTAGKVALVNKLQYSKLNFVFEKERGSVDPDWVPFVSHKCEFLGSTTLEHCREFTTKIPQPYELVVEFEFLRPDNTADSVIVAMDHKAYTAVVGEPHPDFEEVGKASLE